MVVMPMGSLTRLDCTPLLAVPLVTPKPRLVYTNGKGEEVEGICSNFLCDLKPAVELKTTGPVGKEMLMPKDPNATIIMVTFIYLHSIGGLVPLLGYLKNSHSNIRAKSGRSRKYNCSEQSKKSTTDSDVTAGTKALCAISMHSKPAIAAFHLANGYASLRDAFNSERVRFRKKALNLIHYLLNENRSDCNVVTELGFPRVVMHLASSDDGEVREGALRGLLELAQDKTGKAAGSSSIEENEKLKQILQERIKGISSHVT